MQKIREDCFWHYSFKDMSATIDQCELAEPWTCPCAQDCEWYVSKDNLSDEDRYYLSTIATSTHWSEKSKNDVDGNV
jgi:hypothetical protein